MNNPRLTAFADRETTEDEPGATQGVGAREGEDRERFDSHVASDARSRMLLEAVGASHSGRRRLNQDQFLIADLTAARRREDVLAASRPATESLLVVADGLGGHPSGEVASLLAVRTLLRELLQSPVDETNPLILLDRAIRASDEALHRAGVHPESPGGDLRAGAIAALSVAVRDVIAAGIANGGTTLRDYRQADGTDGDHQNHLAVYGRDGEPCPACGSAIIKIRVAGRGTHLCPDCQRRPPRRRARPATATTRPRRSATR